MVNVSTLYIDHFIDFSHNKVFARLFLRHFALSDFSPVQKDDGKDDQDLRDHRPVNCSLCHAVEVIAAGPHALIQHEDQPGVHKHTEDESS